MHTHGHVGNRRIAVTQSYAKTFLMTKPDVPMLGKHLKLHRMLLRLIITGGYVSNASFHRSDDGGQRLCPQCHVISSLHHEFWECPHIPNAATRPAIPECILQQRLGWPSHDKNSEAILAWQVSVRKHQLNLRYKPPVQNAPM